MKNKKILKLVLLISAFLFLTKITVLASKEIEVKSITCPYTIVIGIKSGGQLKGTITLTFEEYLKGVVPYEMSRYFPAEALKAQAVSARNWAVKNKNKHISDGYNLCNDPDCCQVWKPKPSTGYPSETDAAVEATEGIGVTYKGSVIECTYFSSSRNHYTKNTEEIKDPITEKYWRYCEYRRKTITPERPGVGAGGHCAGMSQYGAKSLAENGVTYEDILKHYYGPAPPYVKKVIVTQKEERKYIGEWTENKITNYPDATRRLGISSKPFNVEDDIIIEIHFSERVLAGKEAREIKVMVGNEKASYVELVEGNRPPEKLKMRLTKEQLKNLGDGEHKIKIDAKHEYAQDWQLDKNSATFCYQEHNADILKNYEEGIDENHKIVIGTTPVESPILKAQLFYTDKDGKKKPIPKGTWVEATQIYTVPVINSHTGVRIGTKKVEMNATKRGEDRGSDLECRIYLPKFD